MAAIKESGGGYSAPKERRRPAGATRGSGSKSSKRGTANKARRPAPSNASSAANRMSKAQKAGYAKATANASRRVERKAARRAARKSPIGNRAFKRAPGFDPFDAIGNLGRGLGDAVKNAFGQAVPQDVMFKSITDRIKDATGR